MADKKDDRVLGNELKLKTVRRNTNYFQKLEYREIPRKDPISTTVEVKEDVILSLPIGLSIK